MEFIAPPWLLATLGFRFYGQAFFYPDDIVFAIVFIVAILTVMLFQEAHQVEIIATGLLSIFVVTAGLLVARRRRIEKMGAPVLN